MEWMNTKKSSEALDIWEQFFFCTPSHILNSTAIFKLKQSPVINLWRITSFACRKKRTNREFICLVTLTVFIGRMCVFTEWYAWEIEWMRLNGGCLGIFFYPLCQLPTLNIAGFHRIGFSHDWVAARCIFFLPFFGFFHSFVRSCMCFRSFWCYAVRYGYIHSTHAHSIQNTLQQIPLHIVCAQQKHSSHAHLPHTHYMHAPLKLVFVCSSARLL